jgi:FixJ family two-component response regulator
MDPNARVIIMTGYGDVDTAISAVNNGAYAFFAKPVDISELLEVLDKVGKESEQRRLSQEEQAKMAEEYQKLKRAYDDMIQLLDKTRLQKTEG